MIKHFLKMISFLELEYENFLISNSLSAPLFEKILLSKKKEAIIKFFI